MKFKASKTKVVTGQTIPQRDTQWLCTCGYYSSGSSCICTKCCAPRTKDLSDKAATVLAKAPERVVVRRVANQKPLYQDYCDHLDQTIWDTVKESMRNFDKSAMGRPIDTGQLRDSIYRGPR